MKGGRNVSRGTHFQRLGFAALVPDETVVDTNEASIALVAHAFAEAQPVYRGQLRRGSGPRTVGTDAEERCDREEGAGLVDRSERTAVPIW